MHGERTQCGDMCEMAANSAKESLPSLQQLSVLPISLICEGCGFTVRLANNRKAETSASYMAQRAERADLHACKTLSSGLREASFWPNNGLRSNLIASKFQKFSGGHAPKPPYLRAYARTTNLTTPNLMTMALN